MYNTPLRPHSVAAVLSGHEAATTAMDALVPARWTPVTYRSRPAAQQPVYADALALNDTLDALATLPPLVSIESIQALRGRLAAVAAGHGFVLQAGDCAERFVDCTETAIARQLQLIWQMAAVLSSALGPHRPVLKLGRLAGQYAKPRSADTEVLAGGTTVPCFRGDNVSEFDSTRRVPDPARLRTTYACAAATLRHADALLTAAAPTAAGPGAPALATLASDLTPHTSRNHPEPPPCGTEWSLAASCARMPSASSELFTSHEGLLLDYEAALTRPDPACPTHFYGGSAHFLWIGDRTRHMYAT